MEGEWLKTHCARFDHGGCGLKVLVDEGKAIRVLPDETNKRSKGYACAKGMASLERIYHSERLLYPLKRKGERGEGRWERISWDQALEYAATELNRIKEESGSQAVAFGQGAQDPAILPITVAGSRQFVRAPYAIRTIEDTGHFIHEERPKIVTDMLLDWLQSDPAWDDPSPDQLAIES